MCDVDSVAEEWKKYHNLHAAAVEVRWIETYLADAELKIEHNEQQERKDTLSLQKWKQIKQSRFRKLVNQP